MIVGQILNIIIMVTKNNMALHRMMASPNNILVFVFSINGAHGIPSHRVQSTPTWIHNWASCCHVICTHVSTNVKDYGNQAWIRDIQKVLNTFKGAKNYVK